MSSSEYHALARASARDQETRLPIGTRVRPVKRWRGWDRRGTVVGYTRFKVSVLWDPDRWGYVHTGQNYAIELEPLTIAELVEEIPLCNPDA